METVIPIYEAAAKQEVSKQIVSDMRENARIIRDRETRAVSTAELVTQLASDPDSFTKNELRPAEVNNA